MSNHTITASRSNAASMLRFAVACDVIPNVGQNGLNQTRLRFADDLRNVIALGEYTTLADFALTRYDITTDVTATVA